MHRTFDARYLGQSFELEIVAGENASRAFHDEHRRRYGYSVEDEPVEIVSARLTATAALAELPRPPRECAGDSAAASRDVWVDGKYAPAAVYARANIGRPIVQGPALIEEADSCTYVASGWKARVENTALVLERT